jgi:putative FmdB family regulatory protein
VIIMPVYHFTCKKHGGFEKIAIKAEWDDIRCPKCGARSKVDNKCRTGPGNTMRGKMDGPS